MTQDILLLNRILKLMTLASTDETRYHLGGVSLEELDGKLLLSVTDGHRAIRETLDHDVLPDIIKGKQFFFERDCIPALKIGAKEKIVLHVAYNIDITKLVLTFNNVSVIARPMSEIGIYPDIEAITPKEASLDSVLSFNAKYLFEVAKALSDSPKDTIVNIHFDSNNMGAMIIKHGLSKREAILMPCRPS